MSGVARWTGDAVGPAFVALYVVGFAVGGLVWLDDWRSTLVGTHPTSPAAALGLLVAVSGLCWLSLARRRAVRLSPAALTWQDADDRRVREVRRRLLAGWGWRVALVSWVWTMAAALAEVSAAVWLAGSAGGAAVAVVVLVALGPARTARRAGRAELVAGWREHRLRTGAVQFLDPLLLVGAARPLGVSLAGAALLRFLILEALDRGDPVLGFLLLLGAAVALVQLAPAVPAAVVMAGPGFAALLPAARGLARLRRHPGLRRWVGTGELRLRWTMAAVLAAPAVVWCAVAVASGVPVAVLVLAPVLVAAVVRTVTRPLPRYDVLRPSLLVVQTLRGADVLAVGVMMLAVGGVTVGTVVLIGALAAGAVSF